LIITWKGALACRRDDAINSAIYFVL